jgi:radical SAM superfamily enzyme YgiQ (UPF0313 family)
MPTVRALLVSTYDLGHQPFGLASPAAWLRDAGVEVRCVDLAKEPLPAESIETADLVAFHLPMHTATRLAAPVIRRVHALNPDARICAYGLYAPLNAEWLRSIGVTHVLGGEFEEELTRVCAEPWPVSAPDRTPATRSAPPVLPRLQLRVPDRSGLPPLDRYATLELGDGTTRVAGYTEASRGCRHLCRHCPVVPVYQGQFRIVQLEVVLADIDAQVAAGARHITFGDPDFFNGPTHALRVVTALAARHPALTYDVTIKIEHLLRRRDLLPPLRDTGCLFVTSAVETLDDRTLAILEKGHTRADFLEAVRLCREAGLTLVPTFVPFHPWTTLEDYCDLLDTIEALDLVHHVAPIQLAIRLLVPEGSRLLELESVRSLVEPYDRATLAYPWKNPDAAVDRLHQEVTAIVGGRLSTDRPAVFDEISDLAHRRAGIARPARRARGDQSRVPYMNEPWYCCAEPNPEQLRLV